MPRVEGCIVERIVHKAGNFCKIFGDGSTNILCGFGDYVYNKNSCCFDF